MLDNYPHILQKLVQLYGSDRAPKIYNQLVALLPHHETSDRSNKLALSERDVILITYGDQVQRGTEPPLQTLHGLLNDHFKGVVNAVHILPFYPYSSDDGFSVIDYTAVNPALGTWADIRALSNDYRLMFDAVFNHISAQSAWFQAFLRDEAPYNDYFTVVDDPTIDVSMVVRPRALPLLTRVETASGEKYVWTTFSADQIDLNYANPDVLVEMVRILLFYVENGAELIRLDAIAFLWKEIGTTSIHLEQTHLVIQLMRDMVDIAVPDTILVTETNVPHEENISYFGDGTNEAQMVYQFPLPPLVLHTLRVGDATTLSNWAATLQGVGEQTTFFNFTASHDGIGMRPATGLLTQDDIDALVQLAIDHGGRVSYRTQSDGTQSPYELNLTYFDAITHPEITAQQPDVAINRFIVSQAMMLALAGVPGIYFHSLLGSRNWHDGVAESGHNRTINRQKLNADHVIAELDAAETITARVFTRYLHLIAVRSREAAFHPLASQRILDLDPAVFATERTSRDGRERLIALHNVTGQAIMLNLADATERWHDVVSNIQITINDGVSLAPYQVLWIKSSAT